MITTELQNKVVDSVISIIKTWKNTNDINSPSHNTYIEESLAKDLGEDIDETIITILEFGIGKILFAVQNTKDNEN